MVLMRVEKSNRREMNLKACERENFQLSGFFSAIEEDCRISITHIGINAALMEYWRMQGYVNPIHAFSYEIMRLAKISAPATYHKCIRELSEYGYIHYEPSYNNMEGSRIYFTNFDFKDMAGQKKANKWHPEL